MELKLIIDDQEKTFTVPFISGRALRKSLEIARKVDFKSVTEDTLDELVDYVVDLYKKQFTRDQYYDGIANDNLIPHIMKCIETVVGDTTKATESLQDPNVQTPAIPETEIS